MLTLGLAVPAILVVAAGATALVSGSGLASAATRPGRHRPTATPTSAAPAAPAAAVNPNCTLIVPATPLTATGLATPYQLVATNRAAGACHESNAAQSAFVEASVLDPNAGTISVYHPLVIDAGTQAAAAPVVPTLPAGAVVGIWFGFNGTTLTLRSNQNGLASGKCVNGSNGSPFGQFAYCNAPAFFTAANAAITAKKFAIPAAQTGKDGMPCPTTRDFGIVDQDQSDNVVASYLVLGNGRVAQNTAANAGKFAGQGGIVSNGSDNGLVDLFVDPALGCSPLVGPDLADPGKMVGSLALNELAAAAWQGAPVALVPPNDPMVLLNNAQNTQKDNLYRQGVNQPNVNAATDTAAAYCRNLATIGTARLQRDRQFTINAPSPDPAASANLFAFLSQRLQQSFVNLNCQAVTKQQPPMQITRNAAGVAVDATPVPSGAPSPTAPATPVPSVSVGKF